jgi:gas vesicle protein
MPITQKTVNAKIEKLKASERITKTMLSELSRDLLTYVIISGTMDIDSVNRTISVLTPMNKQTAVLFFTHFLPFSFDEGTSSFGGLQKKKLKAKTEAIESFLEDETKDIWSWAAENVKIEKKKVDYLAKITKDVTKALSDDDEEYTINDILQAVIASDEVDLVGLMNAMQAVNPMVEAA